MTNTKWKGGKFGTGRSNHVSATSETVAGRRKRAMVEEAEQTGMSLSAVARKYGINPNQLFRWRKLLHEGALCAVGAEESVVPLSEVKELQAKVRELERLLGRKTMEVEILKDAIRIAREKKLLLRPPLPRKDDSK